MAGPVDEHAAAEQPHHGLQAGVLDMDGWVRAWSGVGWAAGRLCALVGLWGVRRVLRVCVCFAHMHSGQPKAAPTSVYAAA